jgi:hypothetical protein
MPLKVFSLLSSDVVPYSRVADRYCAPLTSPPGPGKAGLVRAQLGLVPLLEGKILIREITAEGLP